MYNEYNRNYNDLHSLNHNLHINFYYISYEEKDE